MLMLAIKLLLGATLIWLLSISLAMSIPNSKAEVSYVYVFAPDARFVKIDLSQHKIIESGEVAALGQVDRLFLDSSGEQILLETSRPSKLVESGSPTVAVMVLTPSPGNGKPGLQVLQNIIPPSPNDSLVSLKPIDKPHRRLLVSWQDQNSNRTSVIDRRNFELLRMIENFVVSPTSCISSDGLKLHSISSDRSRGIDSLDLSTLAISRSSYDGVGSRSAYYKAPVALDGCRILFLEYEKKITQGPAVGKIYLYDLEKHELISSFMTDTEGEYQFLGARNFILLDQEIVTPNLLPDGSTVGLRRKKIGKLLFYDAMTGKQIGELTVPENGSLAAVSADETVGYYLSSKLLTIVDLVDRRVKTTIDLPFTAGMLTLTNGSAGSR